MPDGTYEKGLSGEETAIIYLQNRGMVLLARRYRSSFGEIDAILRDGDTLVFVEVKARNTRSEGAGLLSVGLRKRAKIIQTALQYIAENESDMPMRFDVVELTRDGVQHVRDAFQGNEFRR